jgi:Riboflavin synthase alpha chain
LSVSKLSKTWTINILVNSKFSNLLIDKGSICINGVSLTIVKAVKNKFTLVIIPHTLKMTNIINLNKHDVVNIEFDIVIKYLSKISNK